MGKKIGTPVGISAYLNQSGIYNDTGLGSAANTVIPANAGVTKDFTLSGCAN